MLRITGGTWGRRRIAVPKGPARPTSDRAREAVFSALGEALVGARVLDLYAGSGALGIEALSRGARQAIFVDNDRGACRTIVENLKSLDAPPERYAVHGTSVETFAGGGGGAPFDVIFADAPYARPISAEVIARLCARLAPDGVWVIEESRRNPPFFHPELRVERARRYGDARVIFARRTRRLDEIG